MAAKYKKRADGRYLIQILVGYSVNGKPKYKNVYGRTIPELENKAAKARDEIEKGISVSDDRLTVKSWAERWLELYKSNVEYNTLKMYGATLTCHIYPALGVLRLKDVKPHQVQELLNRLTAEGKTRTAEMVLMTLRQIFKQAVKNEYLYKNITDNVELIKRDKPKKRALTDEEIRYIRNAELPIKEKTFAILLLTTGLRRGDAYCKQKLKKYLLIFCERQRSAVPIAV